MKCWSISLLYPEVSIPVSMKEVAGYIEKQVAYLSGEGWGRFSCYPINLCANDMPFSEMILNALHAYIY